MKRTGPRMDLGALYMGEGRCRFRVWAPKAARVDVSVVSPARRLIPMKREEKGYHSVTAEEIEPGALYFFVLDGNKGRPDPASRFQPQGVHGPSQVLDPAFPWQDGSWSGIALRDYILYELHVGTFTPEGTFEAIIPRLASLQEIGINTIEIMPVSQFPGDRNWGYDGVLPFAVQSSYGGPRGLKRLVNACHELGLAVTLDVVYNHLGPEGNYLREFGPYFTQKYNTPWGEALNFDGPYSDEVRHYFLQNAGYWFDSFHVDALRLDAVHAIHDFSAVPFLQELAEQTDAFSSEDGRKRYLIAESDLNDSRLIRPRSAWGYGLDAQWSDDFHHSLHALLTSEHTGYYIDFGRLEHLATAINEGFFYSGGYSAFRKRRHGNLSADLPPERFVVALQNHDQIGNRMLGERISTLISFEAQKLGAAVLLLSPFIPLLFMGQEYGEEAPFLYFISHTDPDLVEAVRKGRKEEFKDFAWKEEPPDPQGWETYERAKLQWELRDRGRHKTLLEWYKTLIRVRRELPALAARQKGGFKAIGLDAKKLLALKWSAENSEALCLFNFNSEEITVDPDELDIEGRWHSVLDSSEPAWDGPGTLLSKEIDTHGPLMLRAHGFALYEKIPAGSRSG